MALNIKKLLVSQPKPASEKSPYFEIAEKYGVEIDFRPFIKVEPLSAKATYFYFRPFSCDLHGSYGY